MLCVIYGTYGVGKTTVMNGLRDKYNFKLITPVTTRTGRSVGDDKLCVSRDEFNNLARLGKFCIVKEHFGHQYGTPRDAIERAHNNVSEHYVVDFHINDRKQIYKWENLGIAIVVEDSAQLSHQLDMSHRSDRAACAIEQYNSYYVERREYLELNGIVFITNHRSKSCDCVDRIARLVFNMALPAPDCGADL